MRPRFLLVLAFTCCALTFLAFPSPAAAAGATAENTIAAIFAPAGCGTPTAVTPKPLFITCTVQIECADSSVVSCSGSSTCSTGGTNNRCVVCDGVQHDCCPKTCCEECAETRDNCLDTCPDWPPLACRACLLGYNYCASNCEGGCH